MGSRRGDSVMRGLRADVGLTMAMLLPLSSMESSFVTFLPSAVISLTRAHIHTVQCQPSSLFPLSATPTTASVCVCVRVRLSVGF